MTRRYLFICTSAPSSYASGGMAVIYEAVDTLRAAGVDAFILTDRPDGRYLNTSVRPPILH